MGRAPPMRGVFAQKRLSDGEVICPATRLWFSSESTLSEFRPRTGHAQRSQRCAKVGQAPKGGEFSSLYGVIVGIVGDMSHGGTNNQRSYISSVSESRVANAQLCLHPSAGLIMPTQRCGY